MKNLLNLLLLVFGVTNGVNAQELKLKNTLGWVAEYKTVSEYNSNNLRTNLTTYRWNQSSQQWENYTKLEYSYDWLNLLEETVYSKWNTSSQTWIYDSRTTYIYYAFKKMWSGTNYTWDNTNSKWEEWYKYDNYSYSGNNLYYTYYTWTGASWSEYKKYKCVITLDDNNRISKQVRIEYSEALYGYYGDKTTTTYTYDAIGNVIASESSGGGNTYFYRFTFDSNVNPIDRITRIWDSLSGSYIDNQKLVYKYDPSGKQLEYTQYVVDNSTAVSDLYTITSNTIYPNPVSDILHIESPNGNSIISISDINGKFLIDRQKISNSVDVSFLPTGVYILNVYGGKKTESFKIIKE